MVAGWFFKWVSHFELILDGSMVSSLNIKKSPDGKVAFFSVKNMAGMDTKSSSPDHLQRQRVNGTRKQPCW